jgi:uncharacterized membrane protein YoaK (UPF0700 family)
LSEDRLLPEVLLGMTFVTGLVDAVSYLGLGRVFTALQTGNLIVLAFSIAGASGLDVTRNLASLALFLTGALLGGRLGGRVAVYDKRRLVTIEGVSEASLLFVAAIVAIGFNQSSSTFNSRLYILIALLAMAMGLRSAVVRKLGVADLTTTLLTLTMTGILSESSLAGGKNPRIARRVAAVALLFLGALVGAFLLKAAVAIPLALGGVCTLSLALRTWASKARRC